MLAAVIDLEWTNAESRRGAARQAEWPSAWRSKAAPPSSGQEKEAMLDIAQSRYETVGL